MFKQFLSPLIVLVLTGNAVAKQDLTEVLQSINDDAFKDNLLKASHYHCDTYSKDKEQFACALLSTYQLQIKQDFEAAEKQLHFAWDIGIKMDQKSQLAEIDELEKKVEKLASKNGTNISKNSEEMRRAMVFDKLYGGTMPDPSEQVDCLQKQFNTEGFKNYHTEVMNGIADIAQGQNELWEELIESGKGTTMKEAMEMLTDNGEILQDDFQTRVNRAYDPEAINNPCMNASRLAVNPRSFYDKQAEMLALLSKEDRLSQFQTRREAISIDALEERYMTMAPQQLDMRMSVNTPSYQELRKRFGGIANPALLNDKEMTLVMSSLGIAKKAYKELKATNAENYIYNALEDFSVLYLKTSSSTQAIVKLKQIALELGGPIKMPFTQPNYSSLLNQLISITPDNALEAFSKDALSYFVHYHTGNNEVAEQKLNAAQAANIDESLILAFDIEADFTRYLNSTFQKTAGQEVSQLSKTVKLDLRKNFQSIYEDSLKLSTEAPLRINIARYYAYLLKETGATYIDKDQNVGKFYNEFKAAKTEQQKSMASQKVMLPLIEMKHLSYVFD